MEVMESPPPPSGPCSLSTVEYFMAKAARLKLAVSTISARAPNRDHGGHGVYPGPSSLTTVRHFTGKAAMDELAVHMISSPTDNQHQGKHAPARPP
jgi:hypothetical protein